MMNLYPLIRPLLFRFDPETIHQTTLRLISMVGKTPVLRELVSRMYTAGQARPVQAFGLNFPNPVGLAAGYDKDADGWRGLACLGFGHIEVGTITPQAQPGNPRPRVFRLPEDQALINRMGFPGKGRSYALQNLTRQRKPDGLVLGINIGKNKGTPLENAATDYLYLMEMFYPHADYLAVNVSSPNTMGLRDLQNKEYLNGLLKQLTEKRKGLQADQGKYVPLLVKLAPDLSDSQLDDALLCITENGIDGVIASNTTIQRNGLSSANVKETGGLSGKPLNEMNTAMVRKVSQRTSGQLPIIACGGVMTPDDAQRKLDTGAVLVQVYTGLVYYGPALARDIASTRLLQEV